jgi:hypothetical protein
VLGKAIEPVECPIDFQIAETSTRELVAQDFLIGLWLFLSVDVGLEQVHQNVEYIFFHSWSRSSVIFS